MKSLKISTVGAGFTMFSLIMFLDVSEGKPGMMVPVFSSAKTNMPYVQQMDEFLLVKEIVPFLEYENYDTVSYLEETKRSIAVMDKGIVAFRSVDGSIVCGDIEEILAYIDEHRTAIETSTLLHLQLQRIEAAEINPSYELWRKVADVVFEDQEQRKFWLDSELQLFQKQKRIWSDIDPLPSEEPWTDEGAGFSAITELGTEYLISWLSNRKNYSAKHWTLTWHYVNEKGPFDDRLSEIAVAWMYALESDDASFIESKSVIFALLQSGEMFRTQYPDFGEFLSDRFGAEPSLIYGFLRPSKLFAELMAYLAEKGNLDDVLNLIDFAATELPKEDYVLQALAVATRKIILQTTKVEDNWKPSTRNRDFQYNHYSAAVSLAQRINELDPKTVAETSAVTGSLGE